MRERPILMNGPMVRAILAGQKTQTRRAVKGVARDNCMVLRKPTKTRAGIITHVMDAPGRGLCPFGEVGDRLWVRETWRPQTIHSCAMDTCDCDGVGVTYAADGEWIPHTWQNPAPDDWYMPVSATRGDVPSIHMPRWACRLVLEITYVRVELLQAISESDALAEGIGPDSLKGYDRAGGDRPAGLVFRELWTSTGGDWDSNPWVWVIEFKRVEGAA